MDTCVEEWLIVQKVGLEYQVQIPAKAVHLLFHSYPCTSVHPPLLLPIHLGVNSRAN